MEMERLPQTWIGNAESLLKLKQSDELFCWTEQRCVDM